MVSAGCPNTSLCSLHTDRSAHSTNSAAVSAPEMTPTSNSTANVCPAVARRSASVIMLGRTICMKTGSNGGERGERGVLSTKVASFRGTSRSPIVETRLSSAHRYVRNLVGLVCSRHRSTLRDGAFPAFASARDFRMACITDSESAVVRERRLFGTKAS